ncbi:MAG TPA: nuclear transport factor 2 family protein [Pyrinomonadaceae bacterium]
MKKVIAVLSLILLSFIGAAAQTANEKMFSDMDKQAWDAFGKGDGKFFETFLSDDTVLGGDNGFGNKAQSVKDISTKPCEVKSFSLANYKVTMLNADTALATYEATQDTTCGGQKQPDKVFATSIFVKRKGKWLAAYHSEIAAAVKK